MLVALATLPVLALTIFAGDRIVEVTKTQQDLASIDAANSELTLLVSLETALDSEIYWGEGTRAVAAYGLPNDFVVGFLGIDLEQNLAIAQQDVDAALLEIGDTELTSAIAQARQFPERRTATRSTLSMVSDGVVADEIHDTCDELLKLASGLPNGEVLMDRAERLTDSNELRAGFNELLGAYFLFLVDSGDDPLSALVATGATLVAYEEAADELNGDDAGDGEFGQLWRALEVDESVRLILDSSGETLESFDPQAAGGLDFTDPSALLVLADVFGVASDASDKHLDLVQVATEDLRVELERTQAAERQRAVVIGTTTAAIILMTLLALVTVTRSIVRPIRRLGDAAEVLSTGDQLAPVELSGPAEVQAATRTLNYAAVNLHRAEAQALALADGRLDDVSFDEAATGSLGRSLDVAVSRLRSSLAEREDFRRRLAHEATHDGLTGLPNRRAAINNLEGALSRVERTDARLAVLFIDLDGFKLVNDLHGHGTGDHLLNTVADRLTEACRPGDSVGRLGGDEFLLVAEPVASPQAAYALAERIRKLVGAPISHHGQSLASTVSIGVAVAGPGALADEVIREADFAVYEAKDAGRNQTRVFDEVMRARLAEEADLSDAIALGLEREEFHLSFQPIVVARERTIKGFEALIRWTRPGIGNVPPDEFIGFAEKSDLILDIDRWVLNEGARHLAEFDDRSDLSEAGLSVNISGRHLLRADLYADVTNALERWGVAPSRLTIEITESALLDDLAGAAETLKRLRALGVQVAIDDFGTGYTSLGHLRDLPADVLKIDRSFTQNLHRPDDISLVRLVTETGHLLGMDITVEGVETSDQEELLTHLGVDFQQGYWFGRPAPYSELKTDLAGMPNPAKVG